MNAKTILKPQPTIPACASPETLQGDWLRDLRISVELNNIIDNAERAA